MGEPMPKSTTMQRFLQFATNVLVLSALLLLGVGLVSLFHPPGRDHGGGGLLVDAPVKSFGNAPSRMRVPVKFNLANRSARPIRILGATPFCGNHGCLIVENLPLDIPPLSKRDVFVFVETKEPGEFASDLTLFSDGPGQIQIVLGVNGRVIEEGKRSFDAGEGVER